MSEVVGTFVGAEPRQERANGAAKMGKRSLGELAQECLEFAEGRLDRVEVWRIRRKVKQIRTRCFDRLLEASDLVSWKIVYDDDSQPQRPEKTLAPVAFTLTDFRTNRAEGGAFTLNAKSERGEGLAWTGDLSVAPVSSRGRITITGLQGSTIQQFAGKYLPITLMGGAIGLEMHYDLSYRDSGLHLTLQAPELTVAKLGMDGKSLFHGTAQIDQFRTGIGQLEFTERHRCLPQPHRRARHRLESQRESAERRKRHQRFCQRWRNAAAWIQRAVRFDRPRTLQRAVAAFG